MRSAAVNSTNETAREPRRGLWVVLLASVALAAGLLVFQRPRVDRGAEPQLAQPVPASTPKCRLSGDAALARARQLEVLGDASWERLPFADEEAPRAVLHMAEAESCYRAAFEREGRQRAEGKQRVFAVELARRWSRARLQLELARRREDAAQIEGQTERLLALSSRAGEEGAAYRHWLEELQREVRAERLEAMRSEGED